MSEAHIAAVRRAPRVGKVYAQQGPELTACVEEDEMNTRTDGIPLPRHIKQLWDDELVRMDCFTEDLVGHQGHVELLRRTFDLADNANADLQWTVNGKENGERDLQLPIAEVSIALGKLGEFAMVRDERVPASLATWQIDACHMQMGLPTPQDHYFPKQLCCKGPLYFF